MPTKASSLTPEDHVRLYLQYLEDPESLRDEAAVAKAQVAVDKAKDPIARVKAITQLERAQAVEPTSALITLAPAAHRQLIVRPSFSNMYRSTTIWANHCLFYLRLGVTQEAGQAGRP